ncbi:MAG: nuclear transport factor 2 family protein [Solirubrobacterales bacterium]
MEQAAGGPDGRTAGFVDRFDCFWSNPDPDTAAELVAADAVANWPGVEPIRGSEHPEHIARILALIPDLRLEVIEHAEAGELVFISWRARGTVGGEPLEWTGIDRFRVRDGRAVDALVAYDIQPLQEAVQRSQAAGAAAS